MAFIGCGLWLGSSFLPLFGGAAKHAVRCRGRTFSGRFDDCFSDYLPLLELMAPLAALALLWFFARFAFAVWAPEPEARTMPWRMASADGTLVYHPGYLVLSAIGCAWALWRAVLYPLDPHTFPFITFWLVFACWFGAAAWASGFRARLNCGD
ncbi:hypothetical protein [Novosphingobium olei]|uniref:Uncharacterized protein n=1 Tax=Novosphingobium olei TaxID=2728851 RepID=A0A7Y0BMR0_9SPHN|nr:hypothetical protein [Novosphingobium olei]NML93341.1 hypothetical protein [Novosphingobium olei]